MADERYSPSGSNVMPSSAGTVYWALTDNENSVRDWITYGSLVDHIIYDPFGKVDASHSTMPVSFAFGHNGVFYDPNTGLEYHNDPSSGRIGRWLMPSIQRWLSEDPLGLGPDANPYRDEGNSPTNFTDPTGHDLWDLGKPSGGNAITSKSTPRTPEEQAAIDAEVQRSNIALNSHGPLTAGSMIGASQGSQDTYRMLQQAQLFLENVCYGGAAAISRPFKPNYFSEAAQDVGAYAKGVAQGAASLPVMAFHAVMHPIDTANSIIDALAHPLDTLANAIAPFFSGDQQTQANAIGQLVGQWGAGKIASALLGKIGDIFGETCFIAGTLVAAKEGFVPIETVKAGDEVWAYDVITSRWRLRPVLKTTTHVHEGMGASITAAGETITSTFRHPYWVIRGKNLDERPRREHLASVPAEATTVGRWVDAGDVQVGDELLLRNGRTIVVEQVDLQPCYDRVYNFRVAELECYAVGRAGILVHNENGLPEPVDRNPGEPAPIYGNPQDTCPGHAETSLEIANEEAAKTSTDRVHLNQELSTITRGEVESKLRPDVGVVRRDGTIDMIEIPSLSQTVEEMEEKIDKLVKILGDLAGPNSRVEEIR